MNKELLQAQMDALEAQIEFNQKQAIVQKLMQQEQLSQLSGEHSKAVAADEAAVVEPVEAIKS